MPTTKRTTRSEPQPASTAPVGNSQLDEGDISLIRSMLDRTPTERLERLQDFADGIVALRDGRDYRRADPPAGHRQTRDATDQSL